MAGGTALRPGPPYKAENQLCGAQGRKPFLPQGCRRGPSFQQGSEGTRPCQRPYEAPCCSQITSKFLMHVVDHNSAMKRKEARAPAATRMNLGNMVLRETSQTQDHVVHESVDRKWPERANPK